MKKILTLLITLIFGVIPLLFLLFTFGNMQKNIRKTAVNYNENTLKIADIDNSSSESFKKYMDSLYKVYEKTQEYLTYTIRWGDTLTKIKSNFHLSFQQLKDVIKVNNIKDPDLIISGEKLKIPLSDKESSE